MMHYDTFAKASWIFWEISTSGVLMKRKLLVLWKIRNQRVRLVVGKLGLYTLEMENLYKWKGQFQGNKGFVSVVLEVVVIHGTLI